MNWIKENKFLAGFFGVMIVAVGALGYLIFSANSNYSAAQAQYDEQSTELNRLLSLAPYPDEDNLKKLDAQKQVHAAEITKLQQAMSANQFQKEEMTPEGFQDKLKEAVQKVEAKAAEKTVELPKPFYLGFDAYQSAPPRAEVVPELARELKAVDLIINEIIDQGAAKISKLDREPLPDENENAPAESSSQSNSGGSQGGDSGGNQKKGGKALVARHSFDVIFVAQQAAFRAVLNNLVESKEQIIIPRAVIVKNEKEAAPSKNEPAPGFAAPTPPGAAPKLGSAKSKDAPLVFGSENNEVTLRLEIVDTAPIAAK